MKVTVKDLVHVGPGTLAGRYLRSFWHPVFRSEDIQVGQAVPIRILGEDFTLYRGDSGKAYIVAPRCAHRLTRLHTGQIHGDKIACLYHGWQYDGTGQCTFQPGEDERFTRNTKIAAYPTEEYLGLIWGYFGEGEAPPMRRLPDFDRPGLISPSPPEHWPCNYFNRLDNATDGMHVFYTHSESARREPNIGSGANAGVMMSQETVETEFGLETAVAFEKRTIYFQFLMPNANVISPTFGRLEGPLNGPRAWRAEVFFRVPVDDENTITFGVFFIDLHGEDAEHYIKLRDEARQVFDGDPGHFINSTAEAVLAGRKRLAEMDPRMGSYYSFLVEDYVTQVGQGTIADRDNERLCRSDKEMVILRRLWMRELQALADGKPIKQWAVPPNLLDRTEPQPSWAAGAPASADGPGAV